MRPYKFYGHKGSINSVCFSPDGKNIMSVGDDKNIRIWKNSVYFYLFKIEKNFKTDRENAKKSKHIHNKSEDAIFLVILATFFHVLMIKLLKFGIIQAVNSSILSQGT